MSEKFKAVGGQTFCAYLESEEFQGGHHSPMGTDCYAMAAVRGGCGNVRVCASPRGGAQYHLGPDFGFALEGLKNGVAYGQIMIRVNGQWVPAGMNSKGGVVPAK